MQITDIQFAQSRQELTRHGTLDFPLAIYTTRISRNVLGFIDWHWHHELQFCIVTNGLVDFSVNQETVTIGAGDGIFINANQLHMSANHPGTDSSFICVDFSTRLIAGFDGSIVRSKYIDPFIVTGNTPFVVFSQAIPKQRELLELLARVCANFQSDKRNELQITIWLSTLWCTLIETFLAREHPVGKHYLKPVVRQMIEFIGAHFTEAVALDEIAEHVGFARSTCCREFKQQLGCTISEYILNLRLQEASDLLLNTDESIAHVASACGFSSSSYFITKFKSKTGVSPRAYRQSNR